MKVAEVVRDLWRREREGPVGRREAHAGQGQADSRVRVGVGRAHQRGQGRDHSRRARLLRQPTHQPRRPRHPAGPSLCGTGYTEPRPAGPQHADTVQIGEQAAGATFRPAHHNGAREPLGVRRRCHLGAGKPVGRTNRSEARRRRRQSPHPPTGPAIQNCVRGWQCDWTCRGDHPAAGLGTRLASPEEAVTPKAVPPTGRSKLALSGRQHPCPVRGSACRGGAPRPRRRRTKKNLPTCRPTSKWRRAVAPSRRCAERLQLVSAAFEHVLVHDAARPLAPGEVVVRVLDALRAGAVAVVPAVGIVDSLRATTDDGATEPLDRTGVRAVRTPRDGHAPSWFRHMPPPSAGRNRRREPGGNTRLPGSAG